jgi:HlyD family secretion protein
VYVTEALKPGQPHADRHGQRHAAAHPPVNIGSELSGTVKRVHVDVNDRVKPGQVLVELDTAKLRDQVTRRAPRWRGAGAAGAGRRHREGGAGHLARWRKWRACPAARCPRPPSWTARRAALDRAVASEASAPGRRRQARGHAVATDETNLSKASIRSPIDGVVLTRTVDPGNAVAASLQAVTLFTVAEDLTQAQAGAWRRRGRRGRGAGRPGGQLHRQRLPPRGATRPPSTAWPSARPRPTTWSPT